MKGVLRQRPLVLRLRLEVQLVAVGRPGQLADERSAELAEIDLRDFDRRAELHMRGHGRLCQRRDEQNQTQHGHPS